MAVELLGNVTVVAVEFYRVRRTGGTPQAVTATPTVPILTDVEGHGFIDVDPETVTPDPETGFGRLFCIVTDDPQVAEDFGWTFTLAGEQVSRTVSVPTPNPAAPGYREVTVDSKVYPAVWLLDLASFTGPSVPPPVDLDDRVAEFVEAHDADEQAHPYLQDLIALGGGGGGGATTFDALLDVTAPPATQGLMHRGADGVVRPLPLSDVRTDVFSGDGPPPAVVVGAAAGDLYIDQLTGSLYRLA